MDVFIKFHPMKNIRLKKALKYILISIFIASVITILLNKYIASAFRIEGNSMYPVLMDRERIIISKIAIKKGNINRNDIVVFYKPNNPKKSIIKRVIGLPGEVIEINKGEIYINNKKIDQPFLRNKNKSNHESINMKPLLIKQNCYFVVGDNIKKSVDSRNFGAVPKKYIYGKAIFRYWPFSRFGKIE